MRRYGLILFLLLSQTGLFGQFAFLNYYPFQDWHSNTVGVHILKDGGYMLSGQSVHHYPYSHNARLDSVGNIIWEKDNRLLGIEYKYDEASFNGELFFDGGYTTDSPFQDYGDAYLFCYDLDGNLKWTNTLNFGFNNTLKRLTVSPDSFVVGLGIYEEQDSLRKSFIVKYDFEGNQVWTKLLNDTSSVYASDIQALPNGEFILSVARGEDYVIDHIPQLLHLDRNGNVVSKRNYSGVFDWDPFQEISLCSSGKLLCVGSDSVLRILDIQGNLLNSMHEGPLRDVFEMNDGSIMTYGSFYPQPENSFWIRKRDANLEEIWYHEYRLDSTSIVWIGDIEEATSGDLVISGSISNGVIFDETAILIRTDCEGNLIHSQACQPLHVIHEYALWPNPATNQAAISIPKELREKKHSLKVFDNLGRLIHSQNAEPHAGRMFLDVESFLPGVYYIDVQAENEKASIFKLVVSR